MKEMHKTFIVGGTPEKVCVTLYAPREQDFMVHIELGDKLLEFTRNQGLFIKECLRGLK